MSTRIAFKDRSITNYSDIVAGLADGTPYYLIEPDRDGLQQIADYLWSRYVNSQDYVYDAIDIFSYGEPGKITLGTTVLSNATLDSNSGNLSYLGYWLAEDADILLYGSSVAQGPERQLFIQRVAGITGADVAASTDVTGAALLGGDWTLEASAGTGTIEAIPLAPAYDGTLGDAGAAGTDENVPPLPVRHLAGVDVRFSYTIPYGTFADDLGNPLLSYTAELDDGAGNLSPLPAWLSFDSASGTFSGKPSGSDNTGSPLGIRITATDGVTTETALIELRVVVPAGTPSSDTIYGSIYIDPAHPGTDYILGLGGNDTIYGFGGDDVLYGNGDADSYDWGQNFIYGGDGNDTIYGGIQSYYEYLYGESGNDTIYLGVNSSYSQISGGSGDDLLVGGSGRDRLYGEDGNDTLYGGDGNDDLYGSNEWWWGDVGQDLIYGGDGDDNIYFSAYGGGSTTVVGGNGRDVYWLNTQPGEVIAVDFEAGANGDVLQIDNLLANLSSYDPATNPFATGHLLLVQDGADTLLQHDYDPLVGSNPQTVIRLQNVDAATLTQENFAPQANPDGGLTNPVVLTGTAADETFAGSIVGDTIDGGGGTDKLYGYAGDDVIVMNGSNPDWNYSYDASIHGGAGDDILSAGVHFNGNYLDIYGESGDDTISGGPGVDYLDGGPGSDVIFGNDGDDSIHDDGDIAGDLNTIYGGGGNDEINYYGDGSATIFGGDGDDSITASTYYDSGSGTGTVTVEGGDGSDTYRLNSQVATLISTDFAAGSGGDILYIDDLLRASNWEEGQGNPFADGAYHYLKLVSDDPGASDQYHAGTALQWDRDGAGAAYDWQTVIDMPNVQWKFGSHGLTLDNFAPKADPFGGSDGVNLTGTKDVETLHGSVVADVIDGAGGGYYDLIYGYGGDDVLYADRYGSNGTSGNYAHLYGGSGNDTLWANTYSTYGWNVLYGDAGDDELNGSNLRDYLRGGPGDDTIFGGGGDDDIYNYNGGASDVDLVDAGAGNDSLYFYDASQVRVTGGTGADTYDLYANAGLVTVTDFEPYQPASGSNPAVGDVLYLQNLLSASSNYSNLSGNPFDSGHLQWAANAGFIELQWDRDGASGPDGFKAIIRLEGIQEIDLLPGNYAPTLDGVTIRTITVTDGYVKGAAIYFDADADGLADPNEYSGGATDDQGFFRFTSTHTQSIIAVGGTNIDTGLANLMTLKAPNSATTVNPLTTLVQSFLETQAGATLEQATAAVSAALGLPAGVDILTYDPLAQPADDATALAVQKIAVQVAAVAVLSGNPAEAVEALTEAIAGSPPAPLDLTDPEILDPLLDGVATPEAIARIAEANTAVAAAASLGEVSDVQKEYFAEAPNEAPVWDGTGSTLSGQEGQKLTIFADDLLAGWSDPNGNPISVVKLTATNGTLQDNNDGSWFFTPNAGFSGTVELSYEVTDGVLSSPATASLTIEGVNDSPVVTLGGNESSDEGALYTLALSATDAESPSETLSYSIDWGDGSGAEALTADELAGLGGKVSHVYADDPDTALNSIDRKISVTVTDPDGGTAVAEKTVVVNNVAPTIELTGASAVVEDTVYTLTLGEVTDPGPDEVTGYVVDWGDGTEETFDAGGEVTHVYANPGNYTIDVDLGDEDGLHESAGTLELAVNAAPRTETIRIGDAPARVTSTSQFVEAWSDPLVTGIEHTADASVGSPTWSPVKLSILNVGTLAGGDIYNGDLGVSGQTRSTSTVKQEIDGTEALRFNLEKDATGVKVDLSRFFANDDGLVGLSEALRLRLFDAAGEVLAVSTFVADSATGERTVSLDAAEGFTAVELTAGWYDGETFMFGGYAPADGDVGPARNAGVTPPHGSDFLVDWIEFEVPIDVVGVASQPDYMP